MKIIGTSRLPRPSQTEGSVDPNNKDTAETIGFTGPPFEGFLKLPAEIRNHIWELYCPELAACQPRVLKLHFEFRFLPYYGCERFCITYRTQYAFPLSRQTRAVRRLSAVNKATRDRVLRVFPDVFNLLIPNDHGELVKYHLRFHAARDIIAMETYRFTHWKGPPFDITGVAKNVALSLWDFKYVAPYLSNVQVTTVYILTCSCKWPLHLQTWCVDAGTHYYDIEWGKPLPSWLSLRGVRHWALGGVSRFCFPENDEGESVKPMLVELKRQAEVFHRGQSVKHLSSLTILPMIVFGGESHMRRFDQLLLLSGKYDD